jgi:hypothetical protein
VSSSALDKVFAGSIPKFYDEVLVPLIFAPYAGDLARRVAARSPERILEIAAGTGVVTRAARFSSTPGTGSRTTSSPTSSPARSPRSSPTTRRASWRGRRTAITIAP